MDEWRGAISRTRRWNEGPWRESYRHNDVFAGCNVGSLRRLSGGSVDSGGLGVALRNERYRFCCKFLGDWQYFWFESCEKVECSIGSTDLASPTLRRLHFVISDFTFLTWMRISSVCFVLFLRLLIWKPSWNGPVVTLIQFSGTAGATMWVSFVIWLQLAPSMMLKILLNKLGSFFVAKKAGAQRFIIDARASNRQFLRPPSGPSLTGERLCFVMQNSRGS